MAESKRTQYMDAIQDGDWSGLQRNDTSVPATKFDWDEFRSSNGTVFAHPDTNLSFIPHGVTIVTDPRKTDDRSGKPIIVVPHNP